MDREYNTIIKYSIEEFFNWFNESTRDGIIVNNLKFNVKKYSDRYVVFGKSLICDACKLVGQYFLLQNGPESCGQDGLTAHFNLYADNSWDLNQRKILFTKDHILPKSLGGKNSIENYRTLCENCNRIKGNNIIDNEEIINLHLKFLTRTESLRIHNKNQIIYLNKIKEFYEQSNQTING